MQKIIKLAKELGFCSGVRRAIDIVEKQNKKLNVLGDLVHNKIVIENLKKKEISFISSIEEANSNVIVITAHGLAESVKKEIKNKGYEIIDTTCPFVEKIHKQTKEKEKNGYFIVLIGEKNHIEVKGVVKDLKNKIVIDDESEIKNIPDKKTAVFCQTTQDTEKAEFLLKRIKEKIKNVEFYDTICKATRDRQESAKQLAKEVDLMIVIGGKNSNNTLKLKDVCSSIIETKHIESIGEIDKSWFDNKKTIGVTAGASTPPYLIDEIVTKIKSLK
ncbi:MAG: 4-hydroxy-3-methylbut-2-enyl diphosphate reductase [Candidatus Nanoarchaeia archaeon]|nr:4-hydroxy-3-methylbut-2-enyl diphosphate reductase [Candidatus Nanoarchaeia archaeon]